MGYICVAAENILIKTLQDTMTDLGPDEYWNAYWHIKHELETMKKYLKHERKNEPSKES